MYIINLLITFERRQKKKHKFKNWSRSSISLFTVTVPINKSECHGSLFIFNKVTFLKQQNDVNNEMIVY